GGVDRMFPYGINNAGRVVGGSAKGSYTWHAWISAPMTEIPPFSGQASFAYAINNSDFVVGESSASSGTNRAFLWANGKLTDITKKSMSTAFGINNLAKPQVVGAMPISVGRGGTQGFSWQDGKLLALKLLGGGSYSRAFGVNDAGVIAGSS